MALFVPKGVWLGSAPTSLRIPRTSRPRPWKWKALRLWSGRRRRDLFTRSRERTGRAVGTRWDVHQRAIQKPLHMDLLYTQHLKRVADPSRASRLSSVVIAEDRFLKTRPERRPRIVLALRVPAAQNAGNGLEGADADRCNVANEIHGRPARPPVLRNVARPVARQAYGGLLKVPFQPRLLYPEPVIANREHQLTGEVLRSVRSEAPANILEDGLDGEGAPKGANIAHLDDALPSPRDLDVLKALDKLHHLGQDPCFKRRRLFMWPQMQLAAGDIEQDMDSIINSAPQEAPAALRSLVA